MCGLTFEVTCPWRQALAGRARKMTDHAWSGQAAPAVAGQVDRGVGLHRDVVGLRGDGREHAMNVAPKRAVAPDDAARA